MYGQEKRDALSPCMQYNDDASAHSLHDERPGDQELSDGFRHVTSPRLENPEWRTENREPQTLLLGAELIIGTW